MATREFVEHISSASVQEVAFVVSVELEEAGPWADWGVLADKTSKNL